MLIISLMFFSVALANPFTAELDITQVVENVSYPGIPLGGISSHDRWNAPGNASTSSPYLNMHLNLDPVSLFTVLRAFGGPGCFGHGSIGWYCTIRWIQVLAGDRQ
jgi:hypothetical protein